MSNQLLTWGQVTVMLQQAWEESLAEVDQQIATETWENEGGRVG
jgi:hypothetical protein